MYKALTNTTPKEPRKYHFSASKLSGNILKEYLSETLHNADEMKLFSGSIPKQYSESQDLVYEFNGLLRMSTMVVRDWKERLTSDGLSTVFLDDDIVKDAKCFYEAWSTVHEETGNHIVQKHFFKMIYEICAELNGRGIVEIDNNGNTTSHDADHLGTSNTAVAVQQIVERMQTFQKNFAEGVSSDDVEKEKSQPALSIQMDPIEPTSMTYSQVTPTLEQENDEHLGVSFDSEDEGEQEFRSDTIENSQSVDEQIETDPFSIY